MAGRHITLDGSVHDASVFTHENLSAFFMALAERLDMTIIFGPVFKDVDLEPSKLAEVRSGGAFQDDGGTTGVSVISTSHISIHSWELRKFFQLDVFSCKDFNSEVALEFIYTTLGVARVSGCEILRYDEYTPPTVVRTWSHAVTDLPVA